MVSHVARGSAFLIYIAIMVSCAELELDAHTSQSRRGDSQLPSYPRCDFSSGATENAFAGQTSG